MCGIEGTHPPSSRCPSADVLDLRMLHDLPPTMRKGEQTPSMVGTNLQPVERMTLLITFFASVWKARVSSAGLWRWKI